jgi:hypothetical protein
MLSQRMSRMLSFKRIHPSGWKKKLPEGDNEDLIFSSESMRYKDEPWGDQNLRETFGHTNLRRL